MISETVRLRRYLGCSGPTLNFRQSPELPLITLDKSQVLWYTYYSSGGSGPPGKKGKQNDEKNVPTDKKPTEEMGRF